MNIEGGVLIAGEKRIPNGTICIGTGEAIVELKPQPYDMYEIECPEFDVTGWVYVRYTDKWQPPDAEPLTDVPMPIGTVRIRHPDGNPRVVIINHNGSVAGHIPNLKVCNILKEESWDVWHQGEYSPLLMFEIECLGVRGWVESEWTDNYTVADSPTPSYTSTSTPIPPSATASPSSTPIPVAEILVQSLNVREGPGITYASRGKVHIGDKVEVLGAARGISWIRIQLPTGVEGWISSSPDYILLETPQKSLPAAFFRPPSSVIQSFTRSSLCGRLLVDNGTNKDAVVFFTTGFSIFPSTWETVAAAYIRAGEEYEITRVPFGVYNLLFTLGESWDGLSFNTTPEFSRFEDQFSFESCGNQIVIWEISLHPVPLGNATLAQVPPSQFPALSPDNIGE